MGPRHVSVVPFYYKREPARLRGEYWSRGGGTRCSSINLGDVRFFVVVVDSGAHTTQNRIIFNGVTMHTGTAVTTIGANGHRADLFYVPYSIMERIQVTVFFVQELVLSGLYLWRSKSFLGLYRRRKARGGTVQRKKRSMVIHLILTNVIVVVRMYTQKILYPPPPSPPLFSFFPSPIRRVLRAA